MLEEHNLTCWLWVGQVVYLFIFQSHRCPNTLIPEIDGTWRTMSPWPPVGQNAGLWEGIFPCLTCHGLMLISCCNRERLFIQYALFFYLYTFVVSSNPLAFYWLKASLKSLKVSFHFAERLLWRWVQYVVNVPGLSLVSSTFIPQWQRRGYPDEKFSFPSKPSVRTSGEVALSSVLSVLKPCPVLCLL